MWPNLGTDVLRIRPLRSQRLTGNRASIRVSVNRHITPSLSRRAAEQDAGVVRSRELHPSTSRLYAPDPVDRIVRDKTRGVSARTRHFEGIPTGACTVPVNCQSDCVKNRDPRRVSLIDPSRYGTLLLTKTPDEAEIPVLAAGRVCCRYQLHRRRPQVLS